jgi:hypothetical protein
MQFSEETLNYTERFLHELLALFRAWLQLSCDSL